MTHWLVKVGKITTIFKQIGSGIKDYYIQDKRDFIEMVMAFSLNLVFVIAMLNWVVLPFPTIPKQTVSPNLFKFIFVTMKPLWLHVLAFLGCILFLSPRNLVWYEYIHWMFSVMIKVRNYIVFVRNSKDKITQ